ncbi:hypothetical protein ACLESD_33445 [Pyxidicoccus sp. 3LFB2]
MNLTSRTLLVSAVLFLPAQALAYGVTECSLTGATLTWDTNTVNMSASAIGFPVGAWRDELVTAIGRFNENPSRFNFTLTTGDMSVGLNNNQNEIWWTADAAYDPAVAITSYGGMLFCSNPHIEETDILFFNGESYMAGMTKSSHWSYGGSFRPFQTTALHELGHAMGLGHENGEYNIMGEDWNVVNANGVTLRSYLGEDASDGAVDLYGLPASPIEDVSVAHWKYDGVDGEYSEHTYTAMTTSAGAALASFVVDGERVYYVTPGQQVQVEFVYENNGASTVSPKVGFFYSTNSTITTGDTRLGGHTPTIGRADPYKAKRTVTIPVTATLGHGYVGAYIDEDNTLSEVTSANNATYLRIYVQ